MLSNSHHCDASDERSDLMLSNTGLFNKSIFIQEEWVDQRRNYLIISLRLISTVTSLSLHLSGLGGQTDGLSLISPESVVSTPKEILQKKVCEKTPPKILSKKVWEKNTNRNTLQKGVGKNTTRNTRGEKVWEKTLPEIRGGKGVGKNSNRNPLEKGVGQNFLNLWHCNWRGPR